MSSKSRFRGARGRRRQDPLDRLMRFTSPEPNTGCWFWTGGVSTKGYGRLKVLDRKIQAHRFAYELLKGPILAGLELDHLCRVRCCVNPEHLEPVTPAVNHERQTAARTACRNGHPYTTPAILRSDGYRTCRTCQRECDRRRTARHAA